MRRRPPNSARVAPRIDPMRSVWAPTKPAYELNNDTGRYEVLGPAAMTVKNDNDELDNFIIAVRIDGRVHRR